MLRSRVAVFLFILVFALAVTSALFVTQNAFLASCLGSVEHAADCPLPTGLKDLAFNFNFFSFLSSAVFSAVILLCRRWQIFSLSAARALLLPYPRSFLSRIKDVAWGKITQQAYFSAWQASLREGLLLA